MIQFWLPVTQFPVTITQKINSLCTNFLWKSKAHKMCQDNVCKRKGEGGFEIRKIDEATKVFAAKLLWNYIQGDSLWAKRMHNKYCSIVNFWTPTMDNNASYT